MRFKRKNLTSPRLRKIRRKATIRKTLLFGALLVSVFLGARTFLNLDFLAINSIRIVGAEKNSADEVKSIVVSELSGKWFGIIPKNNFLFMGKSEIANAIRQAFPNVANVKTTLASVGSLAILIEERVPYAKWCEILVSNGDCLMIDDNGFAFEKTVRSVSASTTALTIFTLAKPRYSADIFEKEKFVKLRQFIDLFKSSGFEIVSVTEKDTDYFIKLDDSSEVRVKSEDVPDDITRKLFSIKTDLQKEGKVGSVEYIDLRYGNKVYVKNR